jgi:hypothetical protein
VECNNDKAHFAALISIISEEAIPSMDVANVYEVKWNCKTTASVKALKNKVSNLLLHHSFPVF